MDHTNKPNFDKNAGGKPGTPGDRQGIDKNVAGGKQNIGGRDQQGRNAGQGQNQSKDQQGRNQGGNAGGNQGRQGNQGSGAGTGKSGW